MQVTFTRVHESFSPAYALEMSTKHIDTAAELVRFGASVKIDCAKSRAANTLTGPEAVKCSDPEACGPVSAG